MSVESSRSQADRRAGRRELRLFWMSDANTAHTERWVRALADRGHKILVYSLSRPRTDALEKISGVEFQTAGFSTTLTYSRDGNLRKLAYLGTIGHIRSLVSSFRPDVCHANYVSSYGLLSYLARLRPRVVSLWGADIYVTPFRSAMHRAVIAQVIRSAEVVLSTSCTMREQGRRVCNRPIDVVPFGIDVSRFRPTERNRDDERIVIGTVKALEDKYGIDVLLRAYSLVRDRFPTKSLRLVIAGGGSQRTALEGLARRLGIDVSETFLGPISYARVHEIHQMLDIAVFPSVEESESFGVSVVEAQACGRAVIVSRVGGLPEVVREGSTALVVQAGDANALAQAIALLVENREMADEMGRAGRAHVLATYDLQRCVDQLEDHYFALAQPR